MLRLKGPISCSLELTNSCNNRCKGCSNVFLSNGEEKPILSLPQWKAIIWKLQPFVFQVDLTGGEPTLRDDFLDLIMFIDELGIECGVFSNGRWNDAEQIINTVRMCSNSQGFLISLHGSIAQSHDSFTGVPGSFIETIQNIERASAAGIHVATNTVIFRHNFHEVEAITKLSERLGAKYAVVSRYHGPPIDGFSASEQELLQALKDIARLRRDRHRVALGNCVPPCFSSEGTGGCLAGAASFAIDSWGRVRPCVVSPLICGNLLTESVEKIWQEDLLRAWADMIPPLCQQCTKLSECHGGCKAEAARVGAGKDPLAKRPLREQCERFSELTLYRESRPMRRFKMRSEEFGYVLVIRNRVMPIAHEGEQIIDLLDGKTTLGQIEQICGSRALSFVGLLYQKGFIDLIDSPNVSADGL